MVARLRRGRIGLFVTTGSFSQRAQIEIIDDQYPLILIPGRVLAEQVAAIAAADYDDDLDALLAAVEKDTSNRSLKDALKRSSETDPPRGAAQPRLLKAMC